MDWGYTHLSSGNNCSDVHSWRLATIYDGDCYGIGILNRANTMEANPRSLLISHFFQLSLKYPGSDDSESSSYSGQQERRPFNFNLPLPMHLAIGAMPSFAGIKMMGRLDNFGLIVLGWLFCFVGAAIFLSFLISPV